RPPSGTPFACFFPSPALSRFFLTGAFMSPASPHRLSLARFTARLTYLAAAATAVLVGLGSASVKAQEVGKLRNAPVDLQVFRPAVDSKGFITLNASQILAPKDFSFGLVTTWVRKPLTFEAMVAGARSTFEVQNLITPSFQGAV